MGCLGRGCAAAALALTATMSLIGPARADTLFQVQTAATGVHFTLTQDPASSIITASLVDDATAYTASAYDGSGGSEAQAASVYPGGLVTDGPALFCSEVFTCPVNPPAYPLLADASYPRRQHAQATVAPKPVGSGPLTVVPASAVASAVATGSEAHTSSGGVSALSGTPVAVTARASTSTTRVVSTPRRVTIHVESVVSDITIGGLLHIASVRAVDDIVATAGAAPRDTPHIVVGAVTVGGVPASIDERGVHVAGRDGPRLSQAIAKKGISVHTVGADRADSRTVARSTATGLSVDLTVPVSGLPYVPNPLPSPFDQIPGVNANGTYLGHLTLGAVGAVAGANVQPAFALGGLSPLTPPSAVAGTPAGGAPPAAGSLGSRAGAAVPGQTPQVATPRGFLHGFLDGFTTDLANLYAVLAVGTAVLFVGWRGAIAWRRWRPAAGRRG